MTALPTTLRPKVGSKAIEEVFRKRAEIDAGSDLPQCANK
jgi:hypothetical protein